MLYLLFFTSCANVAFAQFPFIESLTSTSFPADQDGNTDLYDRYFGKKITDRRMNTLLAANASALCTVAVRRCEPHEPRRIDGSCTNPNYPPRGVFNTPYLRMLPHHYGAGNTLRPATDGGELPSARKIRQELFPTGQRHSNSLSHLLIHFLVSLAVDWNDSLNTAYVFANEQCCLGGNREPNRANPRCISIAVPDDDPYLANSPVRCLNLTRQMAHQDLQCIPTTLPRDKTNFQTPVLDQSVIYGYANVFALTTRQYQGGLLREDVRQGRRVPPGRATNCVNNRVLQGENACYEFGDVINGNLIPGPTLIHIWFYLNHNSVARKLAKLNPCWDDDKLFSVARDINIAYQNHIYYYEANAVVLGRKNALKAGVIFDTHGYVDDFNEHLKPGTYIEFNSGQRYFHENQDGRLRRHGPDGKLLSEDSHAVLLGRSGYLEVNRTFEEVTQGLFRQPAAESDKEMDAAITMRLFSDNQEVADLLSTDFMRNRDLGIAPYNHYRHICGLPKAKYFSDFEDVIDKQLVILMSQIYNDVDDVDMNVGIYAERLLPGAWVGPTLHCIITKQLLHWRQSDIYWYEHSKQPTPFTLEQLNEIRKLTMARLVCDYGEEVTEIQKQAFLKISHKNPLVPCSKIANMDHTAWKDEECSKNKFR